MNDATEYMHEIPYGGLEQSGLRREGGHQGIESSRSRRSRRGDWTRATALLVDAARRLERGSVDVLVLCTNTMHKVADEIASEVAIPLLHIADAPADAIQRTRFSGAASVFERPNPNQRICRTGQWTPRRARELEPR